METRDLVRIALFAAVIGALGVLPKIDVPLAGGVPITAQTLGVMLAGIVLGARNGALAMLLFLFVVALGAPFLAGGRGGLGVFFGPSSGFIFGFVPGAYVTGYAMARLSDLPVLLAGIVASVLGGIVTIYAFGIPVLAWQAGMELGQAFATSLLFLPGDIIKAIGAGFLAETLRRFSPQAIASRE